MRIGRREWLLQMAALQFLPTLYAGSDPTTSWPPRFFNTAQDITVIALGERIIPGSTQAFCNRLIDFVMPIESDKNKQDFVDALKAFDSEAHGRHQRAFSSLNTSEQDEILMHASVAGSQLHVHFQIVKEWFADTYWSSQKGVAELGSTGRMAWSEFPNCPSKET